MIDSNIIVSAVISPDSRIGEIISFIETNHGLVICEYTVNELKAVFERKFPDAYLHMTNYLETLNFILYKEKDAGSSDIACILDKCDIPIMTAFVLSESDILVTGDNDFFVPELTKYNILRANEFYNQYVKGDISD